MTTETQLPTVQTAATVPALAVLEADPRELQALLAQTLGSGFTLDELDHVRMPSGTALAFTVPGIGGEETQKSLIGVLVDVRQKRAYWVDADTTGTPPDCTSPDAITGVGDPGGMCVACPLAKFRDGAAPPCRLMADLAFFAPCELLPTILVASPASVRPVARYLLGLTKRGLRYSDVVTRFSLERATSRNGIQFARLVLTMERVLEPAQRSRMRALVATLFGEGWRALAQQFDGAAAARVPGEDDVGGIPEHAVADPTTDEDIPPFGVDDELPD